MDYKASTDLSVRLITIVVTILFACVIYRMIAFNLKAPIVSYGVVTLLVATYLGSFGLCTWSYKLNETSLVIVAPFYNKTINKVDIQKVEAIERLQLGGLIRTFGNGALFGYYGWFRGTKIGSFFFYGTQMKNLILIQMQDGSKYIITPDDPSIISAIEPFSDQFRQ